MKKLYALAIVVSFVSGLYGLTLGIGGAYEDVTDESGDGAYFAAKVDGIVPVLSPILDLRFGLADIEFRSTDIFVGTGISTDLLLSLPMPTPFVPYVVAGFWYKKDDRMSIKGGFGGKVGLAGLTGYIEGGIEYEKPETGDAKKPIYIQGGLRIPVEFGL